MVATPHPWDDEPTMETTTQAPSGPRRAYRSHQGSVIGGVAEGLAEHLAVPVLWMRVGFIVTAAFGGLGIALYAGLWMFLPAAPLFDALPPGLAGATRDGRRPGRGRRIGDVGPVLVLGALGIGALLSFQALVGGGALLWPVTIGVVGVALLWRQADEAQRERWLDSTGRLQPARVVLGSGGWASYGRLAAGIALVLLAGVLVALRGGDVAVARDVLLAALLGVVGIGIVLGPWIVRLASELTEERAERIRTQERADVAAHLHDSVLQTLALIQKNPDDAVAVARLARAQERDLRAWLFQGEDLDRRTVASALRAAAAHTEDDHAIAVDLVTVGDRDLTESLRPIIAAAGEAMTNAAKHAGCARVDVYAEIGPDAIDVFVRDRGRGFDAGETPADRFGVRHSIIDRMQRHGGRAEVVSALGEGTEVRLHLPTVAATEETHG